MPSPESTHGNARATDDGATAEQVVANLDVRMRNEDGREALGHGFRRWKEFPIRL
jgi:hypothetical protein